MTNKEICKKCGADCCKKIRMITMEKWPEDYIKARDLKIKLINPIKKFEREPDLWEYEIKSECPQLKDLECSIQKTKPEACRDFKCEKLK